MAYPIPAGDGELEHYQATAWATARLLGATFADGCWENLKQQIHTKIQAPPPAKDVVATKLSLPEQRVALTHARIVQLVAMMYETAIADPNAPPPTPGVEQFVVLHEWTLIKSLQFKLCLYPFWISGC